MPVPGWSTLVRSGRHQGVVQSRRLRLLGPALGTVGRRGPGCGGSAAGVQLQSFPEGEGEERNVEVVFHLMIGRDQTVGGYPSFCVRFSFGATGALRETCVDHTLSAGPGPVLDECGMDSE